MMRISFPSQLTGAASLNGFAVTLGQAANVETVVLDASPLTFARPFGAVLCAHLLRNFVGARRANGLATRVDQSTLSVRESPAITYLGHVGFWRFVGIKYGNAPGEAYGGATYLPLTVIRRDELDPDVRVGRLQDSIDRRARKLAQLVVNDESEVDLLAYCLREVVRNVFEHAAIDQCSVMAQAYPSSDEVELVVADEGRGVHASLSEAYSFPHAEAAVRHALEPGVTRVASPQEESEWENTGFGLYVLSEFGSMCGSFSIATSGVILTRAVGTGEVFTEIDAPGTAIGLKVSTADAEYFPNRLQQIVTKGERRASAGSAKKVAASKRTRVP